MKYIFLLLGLTTFVSSFAQYSDPYRIAYDGSSYFVTNRGNGTVTELDANNTKTTVISGLHAPSDIFYASLAGNHVLLILDSNIIKIYDTATLGLALQIPVTNSVDAHDGIFNPANSNEFFISDRGGNKIIKGTVGSAPFYPVTFSTFVSNIPNPTGMCINQQGKLIVVSDTTDAKVYEINPSTGAVSTVLTTQLDYFNDVTQDNEGNYYISSWGNNNLYRYTSTWTTPYVVATYNNPSGLYANLADDIMVIACMNCQKIEFKFFHLFSPQSDVSTCPEDSFYVSFIPGYKGMGTYNSDNHFIVELSDSMGNFLNTTEIGKVQTSTRPTDIKCALPKGIYDGSGYQYRLTSTSQVVYSYFTKNVTIKATPSTRFLDGNTHTTCVGTDIELKHKYDTNAIYSFSPSAGIMEQDSVTYVVIGYTDTSLAYLFSATDTSSGCSASDSVFITFQSSISLPLLADSVSMCEGDTLLIEAGNQPYVYQWTGSSLLSDPQYSSPTFYGSERARLDVHITDSSAICSGTDSIFITVNSKPQLYFTLQELEFCLGDTIFKDFSDDSLNFTYINHDQTPLASGGWLADSAGRFGYTLVYTNPTTGCYNTFGNGYGVHNKPDSIRISSKETYMEATVFGPRPNTITWYINNKQVAIGDTIHTDRLQDNDSLHVSADDDGHCRVVSNTIIWEVLSVHETPIDFKVYPNPNNGLFRIKSAAPILSVQITDLSGKVVYQDTDAKVKADLAAGMYILHVKTAEGLGTKKLVIEH